ncbi:MAG: glycosyltransferase family 4 protein [Lachnospiraceae bacterium]|nr:glycosyltransferase family 4 protein [Lachnospiraceae bacterium]
MKILYVTTVSVTMGFFEQHFRMLLDDGHTVELACNCGEPLPQFCTDMGLKGYSIPFSRSPLAKSNLSAIRELKRVIEDGHYDIVHTHTPTASVCVRIVCRKLRKQGLKVFYTAHGFHFYKGAPVKNWLLFYPVEWLCAHWTDVLITINKEDYERARKRLRAKRIEYVPGVGIDLNEFNRHGCTGVRKREELGIPEDAVWVLSVGELIPRKNHETLIQAVARTKGICLTIAGQGPLRDYLISQIDRLGIADRVKLLGFREDISELCASADVFALPSFQEGLSVALMEAMACGLPCVVSAIRGNIDLIDEKGGVLFEPHSVEQAAEALTEIVSCDRTSMAGCNVEKIKKFDIEHVVGMMRELYSEFG